MTRGRWAALLLAGLVLGPSALARAQGTSPVTVRIAGGDVTVVADRLEEITGDNLVIATGNVEVVQGASRISADRVEINSETGDITAQGRVVFYDGESQLTGPRIEYNFKTGTGVVYQGQTRTPPYLRLSGERMERVAESVYTVRRGTFTTCEDDPPSWSFRFGSARADLEDWIYGTNASFWVKNAPLIPLIPFFAAPLRRERQSGFLIPRAGSSGTKGFYAEVPFYWAISDSQDATIALDYYSKRGMGGTAQYRYVLSETNRGSVSGFYLNDRKGEDGQHRGLWRARHDWQIAPGLTFKADINGVSDDNLLLDFGDRIQQRSVQRVESNVILTKTWQSWNLVADAFWYQDLTTRAKVELHRLPEISLVGVRQPVAGVPGLLYETEASLVRFVRSVGSEGTRLDVHPRLSLPISPGGFFTVTPFVGGRLTAYDKTVTGTVVRPDGVQIETTENTPRLRPLFEAGTDVEMIASRVYQAGGFAGFESWLHTIEPRLNYAWITGANTSRLPQWTEGVDAITESNVVQYSLTNRIRGRTVAPPGTEPLRLEVLRLVVGHSYDLRQSRSGAVTGQLIVQPTPLIRFRGDVAYEPRTGVFDTADTDVSVVTPYVTAGLGTRYSDPAKINFLQSSVTANISPYFTARASTNVDVRTSTFVESRFGADIRFQCWSFSIDYVKRSLGGNDISFALNLLGIGGPLPTSVGVGTLESSKQR